MPCRVKSLFYTKVSRLEKRKKNIEILKNFFCGSKAISSLESFYNKDVKLFKSTNENRIFLKENLQDILSIEGIENNITQINCLDEKTIQPLITSSEKSLNSFKKFKKQEISLDEFIFELFNIKIWSAHLFSKKLSKISYELFTLFKCGINVNIYCTSGIGKKGLDLHSDGEAYFIKQISGEKEWYFPIDVTGQYLKDDQFLLNNQKGKNIFENNINNYKTFTLREGDCMHFPIAYPHFAITRSRKPSIHLAVSVHEPLVYDFINFMRFYITSYAPKKGLYQCVNEISIKDFLEKENLRDIDNEWKQYLSNKNLSILKEGFARDLT